MSTSINNNNNPESADEIARRRKIPLGMVVGLVVALIMMLVLTVWLMLNIGATVTGSMKEVESTTTDSSGDAVVTTITQFEEAPGEAVQ